MVDGANLIEFDHQLVEYLRGIMVLQMTGDADLLSDLPGEVIKRMQGQAKAMNQAATLYAIKHFSDAIAEIKNSSQPQLLLELTFIECVQGPAHYMGQPAATVAATVAAPVAAQAAPPAQPVPPAQPPQSSAKPVASPPSQPATDADPADKAPEKGADEPDGPAPALDQEAVEKLRQQWNNFLGAVKTKSGIKTQAALRAVRDLAVADQTVLMAFGNNTFAKDMISEPSLRDDVAVVMGTFLGRPVKLQCQMGETAQLTGLGAGKAGTSKDDGPDPLVEYAVSSLGAEVSDSD